MSFGDHGEMLSAQFSPLWARRLGGGGGGEGLRVSAPVMQLAVHVSTLFGGGGGSKESEFLHTARVGRLERQKNHYMIDIRPGRLCLWCPELRNSSLL